MWHDPIARDGQGACAGDPARVCRGRLFGDTRICVKCGRPLGAVDHTLARVPREQRYARYALARAANYPDFDTIPF